MAMYRSTVNDVIVRTVALDEVSARRLCTTQTEWLKGYATGYHILYMSGGNPKNYEKKK